MWKIIIRTTPSSNNGYEGQDLWKPLGLKFGLAWRYIPSIYDRNWSWYSDPINNDTKEKLLGDLYKIDHNYWKLKRI